MRRIIFSTYSGGRQTYSQTLKLPFNPTTGYQDYGFDRAPGSVEFYADSRLIRKWTTGIPGNSTRLYVNAWYPSWLKSQKPSTDWYLLVDRI